MSGVLARLTCKVIGHRLKAEFGGARQGEPCYNCDGGECVFDVECIRCDMATMLGCSDIRKLPNRRRYRTLKLEVQEAQK